MISKRGIYYDLKESNYQFSYGDLIFYFSSKFYMNKFIDNFKSYLNTETNKIKIKFKCNIKCDEMILLDYYKKIEKRGFLVYYKFEEIDENYFINSYVENGDIYGNKI